MGDVLIAGAGMTTFGKHESESLEELGAAAVLEALGEAGLEPSEIDGAYSSNVLGGGAAGQRVLERLGLLGIPVVNVENACASGSTAVHLAATAIRSGTVDAVVVLGVERMTGLFQGGITLDRTDRPTSIGLTMPAIYALWASAYAHRHGIPVADFARISVKNRRHGVANPLAMFRSEVTAEEVLASKPVADPLTLLQCCANSDGAAALVLVGDRFRDRYPGAARIVGTGLSSGRPIGFETDLARLDVSRRSASQAFSAAGLAPSDVGLAEIHDAFTVGEVLATEAIGLAAEGRALRDDLVPINVSGGLLSKGHPVGATGVAQVVELARQVTGAAGERQIADVRIGVAHTVGGGVGTLEAIASGTVLVSA